MDDDGYPDDAELSAVTEWPATDPNGLMVAVRALWHWPNYATVNQIGDKLLHEFCTGGWSGNESLIAALKGNAVFWLRYWELSERGGRHVFETPAPTKGAP